MYKNYQLFKGVFYEVLYVYEVCLTLFRHIQNVSRNNKLPGCFILNFENNVLQCNHSLTLLLDLTTFYYGGYGIIKDNCIPTS